MKNVVLEKVRKYKQKVFTKKKVSNTISKNHNPFRVDCKIYKRRDGLSKMENKILKETIFIDEESYQQIKKNMCKKDDYFTEKEFEKISVILA